MKRKAILPLTLAFAISVSSLFTGPAVFASDCSDDKTTVVTTSLGYETEIDTPNRYTIKKNLTSLVSRMDQKQINKALQSINAIKAWVEMSHPQYWVFDFIDEVFTDRSEVLENTNTIVDLAVGTPSLSILVDSVVAADLAGFLWEEGPYTVFAPTNEAFEALLEQLNMTFEQLSSDKELLTTVLSYHVVAGKVLATDVVSLTEWTLVETVSGESLRTSSWDGVMVDGANVLQADIIASNGIVHVIDSVILPPSVLLALWLDTDRSDIDIATTAINSAQFPTLIAALEAANLLEALQAEWPMTVYAPTEEAFTKLLADLDMTAQELLADTDLLTSVLTYHVVPWYYTASDIVGLEAPIMSPTVNWASLTVWMIDWSPMVNNANIIQTDIYASNGVIHVIDVVLIPQS